MGVYQLSVGGLRGFREEKIPEKGSPAIGMGITSQQAGVGIAE